MPTKKHSPKGTKTKQTVTRKTAPAKSKSSRKQAAPVKPKDSPQKTAAPKRKTAHQAAVPAPAIRVEALKKTIAYYYLLSYCPPAEVAGFAGVTAPLRKALADTAGMSEAAYFRAVLPEVCRRIVSYHEATREPSPQWVNALVNSAAAAEKSPKNLSRFQEEMTKVARLPGRALPENRLHRKKGCQYCHLPCAYGYFTLISEPVFGGLQELLQAEMQKPASERSPLRPVWGFTAAHLAKTLPSQQGYIHREHLGNLAYCLLMLSMAKSRLAFPDAQLQSFQTANQEFIQGG
ncbi:MAG: hypothetical protein JW929_04050 [Anaerolineales bacterium]|nr:hypothetical protein [Anaerolineales bacterium]